MKAPSTHACVVAPESGTIAGADGRVAITCIARDATLSSLTVSLIADLAPAFARRRCLSAHAPPTSQASRTATITATLYDPEAHLTVAGVPTSSAQRALRSPLPGPNRSTSRHRGGGDRRPHAGGYRHRCQRFTSASNTRAGARFGAAIAATA